MADYETLVNAADLKTDLLLELTKRPGGQAYVNYDNTCDTLMILFVPAATDTFVHYVEDDLALLVETETLQVVGFHIESFTRSFLPQHAEVKKLWSMKGSDLKVHDLGDLMLVAEHNKITIAREIVNVTQTILNNKHVPLKLPMPEYELA